MSESWLAVGGLTLRLTTDDPQLALNAAAVTAPFLVAAPPAAGADITLRARFTEAVRTPAGTPRFEGGDAWLLHADGDGWVITCCTDGLARRPYKQARFDAAWREGEIVVDRPHFAAALAGGAVVDPLDYPLDEVVTIHALAQGRGVAVHAAGLLDDAGRAFVFAGQSGAGKSTIARLLSGADGVRLLSDERVIIRTDGGQPMVYGTPWHGDALFVSPAGGPLAGLFFLEQAPGHAVVPLPAALAHARFLSCAFLPFHDRAAVEATCAAVAAALTPAPAAVLRFAANASVIDVLPIRRPAAHDGSA